MVGPYNDVGSRRTCYLSCTNVYLSVGLVWPRHAITTNFVVTLRACRFVVNYFGVRFVVVRLALFVCQPSFSGVL